MKKKDKAHKKTEAASPTTIQPAAQIEYVPIESLRSADYNPRTISEEQLNAVCRSIVEFGIVDPLIARRQDGLIIGGHQRKLAVERLLKGEYKVKGKVVKWEPPHDGVPVVFLDDITDQRAKMLNIALNKISGDWDYEALSRLVGTLSTEGSISLEELTVTGFSPAELTDFIDLSAEIPAIDVDAFANGSMPEPTSKIPKLDLDFSSKQLRDAVKQKVAAAAKVGELGGDTLARLLGAEP